MVRVQFDIEDSLFKRALPFIKKRSAIGVFGAIAFEEWIKRREGRDGRALTQDEERVRKIVQDYLDEQQG